MKKAIKLAIEGGWRNRHLRDMGYVPSDVADDISESIEDRAEALIDPEFWKCLGKARGWKTWGKNDGWQDDWKYHWHRLIDHLASGKDAESYFHDLLR